MKNQPLITVLLFVCVSIFPAKNSWAQNMGINETGALPDDKAMLDVASTNRGFLMPRMTTTQRDAIASPPNGLQIYNITTSTIDVYRINSWRPVALSAPISNLVYVYSLADLPAASAGAITLDG
ncbi:MAG: hypothetical protein H7Z13_19625, partial [Ferruginibacter sp.]|nr:hypothetical protein [Ferruginibacter sp.]